jgi:very-short-patch-repair endonuclease
MKHDRFPHEIVAEGQRGNARRMRSDQTDAEKRLWAVLRGHRLDRLSFRRQVPIGPYIADFVCHDAKVVVEVDGATHGTDEEIDRDRRRDAWFAGRGFVTLRYTNDDVRRDIDSVAEAIWRVCRERTA